MLTPARPLPLHRGELQLPGLGLTEVLLVNLGIGAIGDMLEAGQKVEDAVTAVSVGPQEKTADLPDGHTQIFSIGTLDPAGSWAGDDRLPADWLGDSWGALCALVHARGAVHWYFLEELSTKPPIEKLRHIRKISARYGSIWVFVETIGVNSCNFELARLLRAHGVHPSRL